MTGSVTFSTAIGGDGSTVTDDDNATTGLRDGGWRTRFVPCFTNQVSIANYVVTQANAASASATAAGSSATSAAAAYDSFDDRYLGSKTSDPTLDNDGNALLTGALYWNSASSVMKVWTGSAWVNPNPAAGYLPLTGGTMTGDIAFAAAQTVDGTNPIGYKNIPQSGSNKTTAYTLVATDVGKYIGVNTSGSIVVPTSTFVNGDAISIYNNTTGNITLTTSAPTAYIGGTNTVKTSITLATRGIATILFVSPTVCVVTGNVS